MLELLQTAKHDSTVILKCVRRATFKSTRAKIAILTFKKHDIIHVQNKFTDQSSQLSPLHSRYNTLEKMSWHLHCSAMEAREDCLSTIPDNVYSIVNEH